MDDPSNPLSTDQLATEDVEMADINTQLTNIESVQQTIKEQVLALESNGIKISVHELKQLLPRLEVVQTSLRNKGDAQLPPLVPTLHIFDMPNEIMGKIFEDLRGDFDTTDDKYSSDGIKNIKSIRLTCKRFCDASSHLLLHQLDVSLTASSLEHLHEVSRHPTISKGIRSLRICVAIYDTFHPRSLQGFIGRVVQIMRSDHMDDFDCVQANLEDLRPDQTFEAPNGPLPGDFTELSEVVYNLGERDKILLSCTRYLRAGTFHPDEDHIMANLSQVYRQHRPLFSEQEALLRDDTFTESVTEAVARLPTVSGLSIVDHTNSDLGPLSPEISGPVYASVREKLLTPMFWTPDVVSRLQTRPITLLYHLTRALLRTGNSLSELRIFIHPSINKMIGLGEQHVKDLFTASKHLKVLDIGCQLTVRPKHPLGKPDREFLLSSLFLNTTKLRSVTLHFERTLQDSECKSARKLLALLPWANLKKIHLLGCSVHYGELSGHLRKLAPGVCIQLEDIHLLSGSWADLLDLIRTKANCDSDVTYPEGNEAAEMTGVLDEEVMEEQDINEEAMNEEN